MGSVAGNRRRRLGIYKSSPKHRAALRASWTEERRAWARANLSPPPFKGRKHSEETKRLMSIANSKPCPARGNGNRGKKHTAERIEQFKKSRWSGAHRRQQQQQQMKALWASGKLTGHKVTEETKQKMRAHWTAERRQAQAEMMKVVSRESWKHRKGYKLSERHKQKIRNAWTPEMRIEQSKRRAGVRTNPNYKPPSISMRWPAEYYLHIAQQVNSASADELQSFSDKELKIAALITDPEGYFISQFGGEDVRHAKKRARQWIRNHPNYRDGVIGDVRCYALKRPSSD